MAINSKGYDKVVVQFDPTTFGIQHIKVFDHHDTELGTIDRQTSDGTNMRQGLYNLEDPDIDDVALEVHKQRRRPKTQQGILLIYRFSQNNDVNMTHLNVETSPHFAFFMLMDPIHTAVRKMESKNPFAGGPPVTGQHQACLTGRIKRRRNE